MSRSFQKIDLFVQLTKELHAPESAPFEFQTTYSVVNCFQWDVYVVYCALSFQAFLKSMELQIWVGSLSLINCRQT